MHTSVRTASVIVLASAMLIAPLSAPHGRISADGVASQRQRRVCVRRIGPDRRIRMLSWSRKLWMGIQVYIDLREPRCGHGHTFCCIQLSIYVLRAPERNGRELCSLCSPK